MQSSDHSQAQPAARASRLTAILTSAFAPTVLRIDDDSAKHAGHSGAAPGGQTHFNVLLVSAAFEGRSRVDRHRAVTDLLGAEFDSGLHALALTLRTPEEHARRPG